MGKEKKYTNSKMRNIPWSEEENEVLRRLWINPNISTKELVRVFKVRTESSVTAHADDLNLGSRGELSRDHIDHEYLKKLMTVTEG